MFRKGSGRPLHLFLKGGIGRRRRRGLKGETGCSLYSILVAKGESGMYTGGGGRTLQNEKEGVKRSSGGGGGEEDCVKGNVNAGCPKEILSLKNYP